MNLSGKIHLGISYAIKLSFVAAIGTAIYKQEWLILFVSSLALFLSFLPAIIRRRYRLILPIELELTFMVFIYSSIFLGEFNDYYQKFWWWDLMLHAIAGIALGFIGFILLYVLYSKNLITASPFLIALFSFSFAVALGALWEIFEYIMDGIFGFNMLKSGLVDTIWDLIVDCTGALLASISGYFYVKYNKGRLFERLISRFVKGNQWLFDKKAETRNV